MERIFSKKNVIILAILWLATNLLFHFGPWSTSALAEVSGGRGIPDIMLSYDLETLRSLFAAYGPQGIAIYKNIQLIDFVYPLIYAALLLGLMHRLKLPTNFRFLYYFPFAIVFFDYSENLMMRHFVSIYPNLYKDSISLIQISSLATSLKWTLIMVAIINILGFWIWKLLKKK
jgi:hypothetical protein